MTTMMRTMTVDDFHSHLVVCAQCKNNPFALCAVGVKLLHTASADRENVAAATALKEEVRGPNEERVRELLGRSTKKRLIANCIVYRAMWCETLEKLERLVIEHEKLKAENSQLSGL